MSEKADELFWRRSRKSKFRKYFVGHRASRRVVAYGVCVSSAAPRTSAEPKGKGEGKTLRSKVLFMTDKG